MKIAVVEDEDLAAKQLEDCLQRYAKENDFCVEVVRFADPTPLLAQYKPIYDMIFMDIVMPHINGFTAAQQLRQLDEEVLLVFVTNMQNYAVKGYEVSAFDFIVKPITYKVMRLKMDRAVKALAAQKRGESISVAVNGALKVLPLREIYYVEISGHTLTYHAQSGDYSVRDSLERAEAALGGNFARCNQCYLVNLAYVTQFGQSSIEVAGSELAVSRNRKKSFMQALTNYLGKRV